MKRMTAVIYCRVSTPRQTQGDGMRRQEETCRDWCRNNEHFITAIFREIGSAYRPYPGVADLPMREAAVSFANATSSVLVVEDLDRFSRDMQIPQCRWVSCLSQQSRLAAFFGLRQLQAA
jgi:DNA invertase Pin-like site-specific DNA recombinase